MSVCSCKNTFDKILAFLQEFFILGSIHLIYMALVLHMVYRRADDERHAIANPNAMLFRIACSGIIFLADFMMLSALLARANYAAFELASVTIRLVAWLMTLVLQIQVTYAPAQRSKNT